MLSAFIGSNSFNYPKSPYAVRDTLATLVADRPDAVVLDFFAGSGTTLQAVCMLNRADGGGRQSILVTNNEVGEAEAARLAAAGFHPGSPEWEARGIFQSVARKRCEAVVTGRRASGEPVDGEYDDGMHYSEGFQENVEFLELTYQDAGAVELDLAFEAVAPLLWLRAGAQGPVVARRSEAGLAWTDRYGVLWNTDRWQAFVAAAPETATTGFVVTDSATEFAAIVSELPAGIEPVRLYENYLTTFAINQVEPE